MNGEWPKVLLRQCPITGGMPTSMIRSAWNRACAAMRRGKVRIAGGYQLRGGARQAKAWCDVCGGKVLPRELTLLTDREAEDMAKVVNKIGVCESCGQKAALQTKRGSKLCSTCVNIRSQVANRPEIVARAARDLSKAEEVVRLIVGDEALRVVVDDAESKVLAEVRGIVGYEGEEPEGLVEAVRKRVLTCASCEAMDVLDEIREVVGYSPNMVDSGLPDAVRKFADSRPSCVPYCADCDAASALLEIAELVGKRGASSGLVVEAVRLVAGNKVERSCADCTAPRADLMRACGLELDDAASASSRKDWSWAAAAAVQTIGELTNRRDDLLALLTKERADNARLFEEKINRANAAFLHTVGELKDEIARLNGQTHSESEQVTLLRDELTRTGAEVVELREKLQAAQSDLLWHRLAADGVKEKLGMGKEDDFGQAPEHVASMMQAFGRFQALAQSEASRADFAEQELHQVREQLRADQDRIAALRERLESTADALIGRGDDCLQGEMLTALDNDQVVLADFARRVLRGDVAITFRGVQ